MMSHEGILAIYDVSGIQEYIFASRRMTENIGGSMIVSDILKTHLHQILVDTFFKRLAKDETKFEMKDNASIQAEIVYIGGGNAVIAYRNMEGYDCVNVKLVKKILEVSASLTLVSAYIETDFKDYGKDKMELDARLRKLKRNIKRFKPMGALPIVEQDPNNANPITKRYKNKEEETENVSTLQYLKRKRHEDDGNTYMNDQLLANDYKFAIEIDDLIACKGQDSTIAIVHIDGNGMSDYIRKSLEDFHDYNESVVTMRNLSKEIVQRYHTAFKDAIGEYVNMLKGDKMLLPIRPLIFDGDDLTFLCKASLAIPLTSLFMRYLMSQEQKNTFTACAGICFVRHNFPFDVGYEVAENLCHRSKMARLMKMNPKNDENTDFGYLSYYVIQDSYVEDIAGKDENVSNRSYRVSSTIDSDDNSLDKLYEVMKNIEQKKWNNARLIKFQNALKQDRTDFILEEFASRNVKLDSLLGKDKIENEQDRILLLNAIELIDLYDTTLEHNKENGVKCI